MSSEGDREIFLNVSDYVVMPTICGCHTSCQLETAPLWHVRWHRAPFDDVMFLRSWVFSRWLC